MSTVWLTVIEANPDPVTIRTSRTAVIVIDMQNDFCSKGGLFDRAGVNISIVQTAVGPTRRVLSAARDAGIKIVYLKMGFRPDLSDLGDADSPNRARHLQLGVGQPNLAPDGSQGRFLIRAAPSLCGIEIQISLGNGPHRGQCTIPPSAPA